MATALSNDLRKRVLAAVDGGLSRRQAAARFGVGISTVIRWVRQFLEAGSVAPGKMGGHRSKTICGGHHDWLVARCREKDFTLREVYLAPSRASAEVAIDIFAEKYGAKHDKAATIEAHRHPPAGR